MLEIHIHKFMYKLVQISIYVLRLWRTYISIDYFLRTNIWFNFGKDMLFYFVPIFFCVKITRFFVTRTNLEISKRKGEKDKYYISNQDIWCVVHSENWDHNFQLRQSSRHLFAVYLIDDAFSFSGIHIYKIILDLFFIL